MTDILYAIDRLINKPVKIQGETPKDLKPNDKIIYKDEDKKEMVATVLGYQVSTAKKGTYVAPLNEGDAVVFENNQKKANELFTIFKKDFREAFPESKPVTARMNLSGNHVYFYFFAETRFNFAEFVKGFRQKIGMNFFLYQVGARDRVRLHPNLHERYDPSGLPLTYHIFKHGLPNVEGETIAVQQLGGRNNDRLKDRSGKLDHTLNFEKDFYEQESKKYPRQGQIVTIGGKKMKCTGYNLLTGEINLRGKGDEDKSDGGRRHGEFKKVPFSLYEAENKIQKKTSAVKRPSIRKKIDEGKSIKKKTSSSSL